MNLILIIRNAGLTIRLSLIVVLISITEAPPKAWEINETSAESNSEDWSAGKFSSIK